jgi:polysaccharide export outer membrane protein
MTHRFFSLICAVRGRVSLAGALCACLLWGASVASHAQGQAPAPPPGKTDYALGAGDAIRILVFQNPDLTMETRLSENGLISYPLIGPVDLGGLSLSAAENKLSAALQGGGFLQSPQVTISLTQVRNNQVSVLGQVARPGRFPLENAGTRVSDMLATAGGIVAGGDDMAILSGMRGGKPFRQQIDIASIFLDGKSDVDLVVQGGDTLYVHRAAVFYIYGEAQRAGAYRIERDMTVMQAIAQGGGTTNRGSEKRLRLHRRGADGQLHQVDALLSDPVLPNDVLFVKESIF